MSSRQEIDAELKRNVVPALRATGFKGSMPHFRRIHDDDHVDLLTFQFASAGGSFVVEIGFADPQRNNLHFKKETPPNKLRVSQTNVRHRLGAADGVSDFWFAHIDSRITGITGNPVTLADKVLLLLDSDAEPWWASKHEIA